MAWVALAEVAGSVTPWSFDCKADFMTDSERGEGEQIGICEGSLL